MHWATALLAIVAGGTIAPDCGVDLPLEAERALLDRHAPLVLIAPDERAYPASVEWVLARSAVPDGSGRFAPLRQWLVADSAADGDIAPARPMPSTWEGSHEPADWIVYGHAYGAEDGGVLLQYWFFYPFNDFHGLGDHEGDWEHVTVRLDPALRPVGAWYAQHDRNAPGEWHGWAELQREGGHPVVLAARGSHASYADPADVGWLDASCPTRLQSEASERGCGVWRTWHGATGGIVATGTRSQPHPRAAFLRWPGQWGARTGFARLGGSPPGPAFQPGWCSAGAQGMAEAPRAARLLESVARAADQVAAERTGDPGDAAR